MYYLQVSNCGSVAAARTATAGHPSNKSSNTVDKHAIWPSQACRRRKPPRKWTSVYRGNQPVFEPLSWMIDCECGLIHELPVCPVPPPSLQTPRYKKKKYKKVSCSRAFLARSRQVIVGRFFFFFITWVLVERCVERWMLLANGLPLGVLKSMAHAERAIWVRITQPMRLLSIDDIPTQSDNLNAKYSPGQEDQNCGHDTPTPVP